MTAHSGSKKGYHRYHIETRSAPDLAPWPTRFKVKVGKVGLARHLVTELIKTRFDIPTVTSRPCMYGTFSGPVGGFAPRPKMCVGCLRCTTEYPDFVVITPNPERRKLGDSYFTYRFVDAIAYESESGRVPVKGAGYRGKFGGQGWDGMWTDMSEIVRPTRDGIHGREFISTVIDIGSKPPFLVFDETGEPASAVPQVFSIPLPFFFDVPADCLVSDGLTKILVEAAGRVETLVVLPVETILYRNLQGEQIVPLVRPSESERIKVLPFAPRMIEMEGWDASLFAAIRERLPACQVCLRVPFPAPEELLGYYAAGVRVFHLTADYHGHSPSGHSPSGHSPSGHSPSGHSPSGHSPSGHSPSGHSRDERFVFDLIREAHNTFVEQGIRDEVTLLGSGGIVAAEHTPKAIIAGLDGVALDSALMVALQGRFDGEFTDRHSPACRLPRQIEHGWGVQRLMNLSAAWRDQLLEILGAMGLREVRRLRGEMGRAMFQVHLEREAFAGIEGYDD